ncbi:MAG TPA: peptidase domain-containing ABC transporter [Allosphingosinicella sp.]|nr:peptidase domain-containing ABC transporter [Allosphingosinicella sp.]
MNGSDPNETLNPPPRDAESGIRCVLIAAMLLGRKVDPASARGLVVERNAAGPEGLLELAESLDLTGRLLKATGSNLSSLPSPAILQLDNDEYVVIEKFSRRKALIHTTNGQIYWEDLHSLGRRSTGKAIEIRLPTDFDRPNSNGKLKLGTLLVDVGGLKRAVGQTLILSVFTQFVILVTPYYVQIAIDNALIGQNVGIMKGLAIGFILFILLNGVALYLRSAVLSTISTAVLFRLAADLSRKLYRLPMEWFGSRSLGETLARFRSIALVKQLLGDDLAAGLVDGALALLTLVLMTLYAPLLALISVSAFAADVVFRTGIAHAQRQAREEYLVLSGHEHSILLENIRGVRSIRLANKEVKRQGVWQAKAAGLLKADLRFQNLANMQAAAQRTLFSLENILVIWVAVYLVTQGQLTLGMLVAYLAYKMQFLAAAGSAMEKVFSIRLLRPTLDQLSDIALQSDDVPFARPQLEARTPKGRIELRGIHHRYAGDLPFVLKGVDLLIEPGESIVITGPSGGGKTTLLQIILGILVPTSGEVLLDGVPLQTFGHRNYYHHLGVVMQDDNFFAGSIAANISMFDDPVDMEGVNAAAELASISDDIIRMPLGYHSVIDEAGAPLSGGQRQRLLLARAIYRKPKILVVDEGTSQLDEACEKSVSEAIAGLGTTRVIVAHRHGTIAAADRVLHLVNGILVEDPRADGSGLGSDPAQLLPSAV